ncbi:hypothetical protein H4J02_02900 [Protaetiibacter sp. SSC-01]|nr:hypothetical protein [Protaetiibacter sp. SSC-01]QNO37996.1 hypothetical protein H4J02_02900 [Protaetiibacter sp. SSC-01]
MDHGDEACEPGWLFIVLAVTALAIIVVVVAVVARPDLPLPAREGASG